MENCFYVDERGMLRNRVPHQDIVPDAKENAELEELRRFKREAERKPLIDELCKITEGNPRGFDNFTMEQLRQGLEVARAASARRHGLNTGGGPCSKREGNPDNYCDGYELDPKTNELVYKRIVSKDRRR